jgi:hypothetical protein
MTDNFNYQDVFKTNIPELDQNIALHAKYLLGAAQNKALRDSKISQYLRSNLDTTEITQAIWELPAVDDVPSENESTQEHPAIKRPQRLLAITVMGDYYRIGLDRRPTPEHLEPVRWSADGHWLSGPSERTNNLDENGERTENFYDVFYETVAALGLHHRLQEVFGTQSESSSAIFAKAA